MDVELRGLDTYSLWIGDGYVFKKCDWNCVNMCTYIVSLSPHTIIMLSEGVWSYINI